MTQHEPRDPASLLSQPLGEEGVGEVGSELSRALFSKHIFNVLRTGTGAQQVGN